MASRRPSNLVGSIARWVARGIDPFVPAACFASTEELRRARLALLLCALSISQAAVFASLYFFAHVLVGAYSVLATGALCLFTPKVLRVYSARVAHHYMTALTFSVVVIIACVTGGLFAPALWWMSLLPVMTTLSCGKRDATAWLAIVGASLIGFAVVAAAGVHLHPIADHDKLGTITLMSMGGLAAVLFFVASSYETTRERMVHSLGVALQETKRAERELRQAQKLEAIGRLASGVAHEINTPLQYVRSSIDFVEEAVTELVAMCDGDVPADTTSFDYLRANLPDAMRMMGEGLGRVSAIVASLRELAHPSTARTSLDVNHIVRAALTLAAHEYKYVADVETALGSIPHVDANAGEINQVLLNLIVNAAHAIAERGSEQRGKIRVCTVSDSTAVTISVDDDGVGVDEGIEDKLYDPFFTTKPIGQGTGQGLAIARTIVAAHAGSLSFTSKRGVGTTFFVRLPIAREAKRAA